MTGVPFSSIPEAPEQYNSTTVLSRLVDGLGFRYHWATEGLEEDVLAFRPEASCRSIGETLDHILNIVDMVEYSVDGKTYALPEPEVAEDVHVRRATLEAIERISRALRTSNPEDIPDWKVRFRMGDNDMEFPFWNTINGTITDAIYHVGQVVALRRAAGAPIADNTNMFLGVRAS